ncbi:hypothetical protein SNE40_003024 [Patella caerulea]|uniref:Uncharacterized protein n=1 Tax=Patella caerulea TaxID=87958 RepID=A0AAN8Q843_PATCE
MGDFSRGKLLLKMALNSKSNRPSNPGEVESTSAFQKIPKEPVLTWNRRRSRIFSSGISVAKTDIGLLPSIVDTTRETSSKPTPDLPASTPYVPASTSKLTPSAIYLPVTTSYSPVTTFYSPVTTFYPPVSTTNLPVTTYYSPTSTTWSHLPESKSTLCTPPSNTDNLNELEFFSPASTTGLTTSYSHTSTSWPYLPESKSISFINSPNTYPHVSTTNLRLTTCKPPVATSWKNLPVMTSSYIPASPSWSFLPTSTSCLPSSTSYLPECTSSTYLTESHLPASNAYLPEATSYPPASNCCLPAGQTSTSVTDQSCNSIPRLLRSTDTEALFHIPSSDQEESNLPGSILDISLPIPCDNPLIPTSAIGIQGQPIPQTTPLKPKVNLQCFGFGNFTDSESEFDDDDDDRDPEWTPRKKTSMFELDSDDGVQPIPVDDILTTIIIDSPNTAIKEHSKSRAKRGRSNPSNWDRNINKKLRMEGKSYRGLKQDEGGKYALTSERMGRQMGELKCTKSCRMSKKCSVFNEEERQSIFNGFWADMSWNQKKVFVAGLIDEVVASNRKKPAEESRKKKSFKYYLKKENERVSVCRNMFLATLGVNDKTVYEWLKGNSHAGIPKTAAVTKRRVSVSNTEKVNYARHFLNELPKLPSHYCRSSSKKNYLEPVFTSASELYKVYVKDCKHNDKPFLRRKAFTSVFNDLNLGIHRPKKDRCDICCGYETNNISEADYNLHMSRKNEARAEKAADKLRSEIEDHVKVVTLDLQSLLLCPLLTASSMYYKTKLGCHNYTIFDLASKDVVNYFWHEGIGDLNANTFASCLNDYINSLHHDVKELILYSDGCTYQNRNVILSNMLLKAATEREITIVEKFLEKGHTQMECDSVHSTIERRIRGKPIYIPQNYVDLIRTARVTPLYKVKYLSHDFFKTFSQLGYYSTIRPGARSGDPVVTDIRVLQYKDGNIKYKTNFTDEFNDLPRRNKRCPPSKDDPLELHCLYDAPLQIKSKKYTHLQELKKVLPSDYHPFYDNLLHEAE